MPDPGNRARNMCLALICIQRWLMMVMLLDGDHCRHVPRSRKLGLGSTSPSITMSRRTRLRRASIARRRTHLLQFCKLTGVMMMIYAGTALEREPRTWIIRQGMWWEYARANFNDDQWKQNFRMKRANFMFLVEELRADLEKNYNRTDVVSVEKRVAIAIWRLATPNAYRCISHIFGVGKTTAWLITHSVCQAIVNRLLRRFIRFPSGEYLQEVKAGFEQAGMPQAIGAIDGSHIPIKAPKDNPADYYNRKCFYSVVMQAVVDHKCRFTDIYLGWPGSVHDARVLSNSSIYQRAEEGTLFPEERRVIAGRAIPLFIIGDPAYPLRSWLMKGYPDTGRLTAAQVNFNHQLSQARMVVERSFGLLKGRWRSLSRISESKVENMPRLIAACCVLHNICQSEMLGEDVNQCYAEQQPVLRQQQQGQLHGDGATPTQYRAALTEFLAH